MDVETTARVFSEVRPYLFAVAYRMTGSASDADDIVQDAWLRFHDARAADIRSPKAYLTTVVSRLCLDHLKSARVQRERYVGPWLPEPVLTRQAVAGPAETVEQRDDVALALLLLLERLRPEERVAFVLHEAFALPFAEIATHLGMSTAACRQLAHRARRRLELETARPRSIAPPEQHRALAEQFLAAVGSGQVGQVAALLAGEATLVADGGAARQAFRRPIIGADRVSRALAGLVGKVPPEMQLTFAIADVNGAPAIVVRDRGTIERVILLTVTEGRITGVGMVLNPDKLRHLERTLGTEDAAG